MQTKLLFDLSVTQPQHSTKIHGGGKYGEIIFRRIVERKLPIAAIYNSTKWFNPNIKELITKNNILLLDKQQEGKLEDLIAKYKFKKLYSPIVYDELFNINTDIDIVATIHGLRPLESTYDHMMFNYKSCTLHEKIAYLVKRYFPRIGYQHAYSIYKNAYEKKNFRFAMVSKHSQNALLAYMPQFKDRNIQAFYSPSTTSSDVTSRKYHERYYLMVSADRWEKNCLRSIIAFDRLFSNGFVKDVKVRITGASSSSEYKYHLKNPDNFEFMGYVDYNELEQLYHDAYAFIYPSLNEGFGYPPIEAMHYGTPCIVSPFTSIPEICEGAAIYTNPYSIEEIMNRILMMENPEIHEEHAQRAIKQEEKIRIRQDKDLNGIIDYIYNIPKNEH